MAKASKPAAKGGKKKMTKSAFIAHLQDWSAQSKKEVSELYDKIVATVGEQLKKNGEFILPGIAKLKVKKVDAVKGGEKKIMPATGKEYVTKAKPASKKVKAFAVKSLKDAIN
ncbi:MAG: HU family DNA-binding protein [Fimbriiglobus sp.]|nr:HU family DNA-binding protein [Fimbriiglobus sp.]